VLLNKRCPPERKSIEGSGYMKKIFKLIKKILRSILLNLRAIKISYTLPIPFKKIVFISDKFF
jgi:hypothetical protein